MPSTTRGEQVARRESGFALIMAILTLVLMTFLGLTMAATTSTELQIAANYRWTQQALYNADAGLEVARRLLREEQWATLVPLPRGSVSDPSCGEGVDYLDAVPPNSWARCPPTPVINLRPGPYNEANRSWENSECDSRFYQGFGQVLDSPSLAFPLQNVSTFLGKTLNGTFTVWIRRPMRFSAEGAREDDPWTEGRNLILTVEGTAPYTGAASVSARAVRNRSVRYTEAQILQQSGLGCGENRRSTVGVGPLGANYDPCAIVGYQGIGAISDAAQTQ